MSYRNIGFGGVFAARGRESIRERIVTKARSSAGKEGDTDKKKKTKVSRTVKAEKKRESGVDSQQSTFGEIQDRILARPPITVLRDLEEEKNNLRKKKKIDKKKIDKKKNPKKRKVRKNTTVTKIPLAGLKR